MNMGNVNKCLEALVKDYENKYYFENCVSYYLKVEKVFFKCKT